MSMPTFPQKLLRAALWLLMYGVVATVAFGGLIVADWIPFPLNFLALWLVETPLLYYLCIPICRVIRVFDYLSAYTLLYGSKRRGKLAVHLGMNHDIFWRLLPIRLAGESLHLTLQRDIQTGMSELCRRIEEGRIRPDATISVGSYFLSPRKLERLGMKCKGRSFSNAVNFLAAYPAILVDQLLLRGRIQWFNPFTVTTYTITASDLLAHRAYFERKPRLASSPSSEPSAV
ncbi:MAG: hypothetical protein JWL77_566 [Chthonomonadaceae bacterium]|nr:hypothetical protein [Chthonomonadaceae bacterium]